MKIIATKAMPFYNEGVDRTEYFSVMPEGFLVQNSTCSFCDTDKSYFDDSEISKIICYLTEHPNAVFAEGSLFAGKGSNMMSELIFNHQYESFVANFERKMRMYFKKSEIILFYNIHFFNYSKITFNAFVIDAGYQNVFRNIFIDDLLNEI